MECEDWSRLRNVEARNGGGVGDISKYVNKGSGLVSVGSDCTLVLVRSYCASRGAETSFSCLGRICRKHPGLAFAQLTTAQMIAEGRLKISH